MPQIPTQRLVTAFTCWQATRQRAGDGARPTVLALSNPAESSECTAQEAADFSGGAAVFASGTAFPPVRRRVPAQANNSLVFPGAHAADENLYSACHS